MARVGTKLELEALRIAGLTNGYLASLYDKLTKPKAVFVGAPVAKIQEALVAWSNGLVVPVAGGPGFWSVQSRKYGDLGATVDDAVIVGAWMARQGWMAGRTYTIDSMVNQWPSWLAKAKAEGNGWKQEPEAGRKDWSPE